MSVIPNTIVKCLKYIFHIIPFMTS